MNLLTSSKSKIQQGISKASYYHRPGPLDSKMIKPPWTFSLQDSATLPKAK